MKRTYLAAPYMIWAAAFIVLPLGMVVYYGCTDSAGHFTLANLAAMSDWVHYRAFTASLVLAFLATLICLVIAYPLAWFLSQNFRKSSSFVVMLFILPMWINFLLRVLSLQVILSKSGILNALLGALGLPALRIIYTKTAILIGMVYDYIPFMILPIYNALTKIDESVVEAARDLGADRKTVFRRIIFPLSLPGVISGIIMVFIPNISEFAVADILGGSKILLFGNVIEQEFNVTSNWNLGSGLSVVLMVFVFASMAIMNRKDDTEEGGGVAIW